MKQTSKWWHRAGRSGVLDYGHGQGKQTQYVDEYIAHNLPPPTSFRPNQAYKQPGNKMSSKTTFRIDYQPHELQKHELPPKLPYIAPTQAMQDKSMYTYDYPGHQGAHPAQPIKRREQTRPSGSKFDAMPTYSHDYRQWTYQPMEKFGPVQSWAPPTNKMEGMSTFQRDFPCKYQAKRESAKPVSVALKSSVPLETRTMHRSDFVAHQLEKRAVRTPQPYVAPSVPMANVTTFRDDFTAKQASVRESMKPSQSPLRSKQPLANSSEFRDRFIAWPVDRPNRHQMPSYVPPTGQIDLQTTTGTAYVHTNGRPAEALRPPNKRGELGQFDGNTNYRNDFRTWPVKRELHKMENKYLKSDVPFDGVTTFSHFYKQPVGVVPSKSCKPGNDALRSQHPLDDRTIYKSSYVTKSMKDSIRYPTPEWFKQREGIKS